MKMYYALSAAALAAIPISQTTMAAPPDATFNGLQPPGISRTRIHLAAEDTRTLPRNENSRPPQRSDDSRPPQRSDDTKSAPWPPPGPRGKYLPRPPL